MQQKASSAGVQKAAGDRIEDYSRTAHDAVDKAAEAASRVAGRVGEGIESLQARRDELMDMPAGLMESARDYVREHPFQALGIALAAGYVLSMMMRGDSD